MVNSRISNQNVHNFIKVSISGIDVDALRLTYTGELGWELYCPIDETAKLYDSLLEAGEGLGNLI